MKTYNNPAEIRNDWEAGQLTAIEAHILLKAFEDSVKPILDEVRPYVRLAAEHAGATAKDAATVLGYEVKLKETGTVWDYSGCGCARLAALEKQFEEAKEALEARKKYLQTTGGERNIDPETGEPTEDESGYPEYTSKAVKTSTSFVTVSKPKEAAKKPAPVRNEDAYHEMPADRELTNYK